MTEGGPSILIAGGSIDPHLIHLTAHLRAKRGVEPLLLTVGKDADPALTWSLHQDELFLNGRPIAPEAVFLRHDVFSEEVSFRPSVLERAYCWYVTAAAWVESHPNVRLLNRRAFGRSFWKPTILLRAKAWGLRVPWTLVSNDISRIERHTGGKPFIAKPIDGGDYCRKLGLAIENTELRGGVAPQPAIVQPQLVPPEVRVYGIAGRFLGFQIRSTELDYRADKHAKVEVLPSLPTDLTQGLSKLMDEFGLDFCAADFKTDPATGELVFLEVNDAPMFALFDEVAGGALADAIASFLIG